jgi:hypothetical protein
VDVSEGTKVRKILFFFGDGDESAFGGENCARDFDAEKTILVRSLGVTEIKPWRNFDDAFERAIVNFHDEELAFRVP